MDFDKLSQSAQNQIMAVSENLSRPELESGISIHDPTNDRSVYSLVPTNMKRCMQEIDPKWLTWKESTLRKKVDLDIRDHKFKTAFWIEYDRCQERQSDFSITTVLKAAGVTWVYYLENICKDAKKMAWYLYPPADYILSLKEILTYGIDQMREVMTLPNMDDRGRVNTALIKLKLQILQNAEQRVMGAVKQHHQIDQRSVNYNVNQETKAPLPSTMVEIEKEIKKLAPNKEEND